MAWFTTDCIVCPVLYVQFAPHGDQTLTQLVDVLDYAVVHTLHTLFFYIFSSFGSAKIIEIC